MTQIIYIVGHKNPDTDSVISAITYAELKNKSSPDTKHIPIICGEINDETKFILDKFNIQKPQLKKITNQEESIILVDHSSYSQAIDDLKQATITEIIDHHALGGIETKSPIYARIEPVGCSATIIYKLFKENDITIEQNTAKLLISAIISDTLYLKSPTSTDDDKIAIEKLNMIANLNLEDYAFEIFNAKGNIDGKTPEDILNNDSKEFDINNKKVIISQIETVNTKLIMEMKDDIISEMKTKIDQGYHSFFFMITDILKEGSILFILSKDDNVLNNFNIDDHQAFHEGMMSRKKDLLPKVMDLI